MASETASIVIIGGGAIGLGVAYHLAKRGAEDVVLLERNQLTSGTSWHAAGIVGPLRSSINLTRLAIYATELFQSLEEETGQSTGYRQTGGLWLAQSQARLTELKRIAAMGELTGLDARIVSPGHVHDLIPHMRTDDLAGALWVSEDGQANPVDVCMAYAKGARAGGVKIREGVDVIGIATDWGAIRTVRTRDGENIRCNKLIVCGGAWSRHLGAMAGVPIPLQAVEHMYIVTESMSDLASPFPVVRDLDGRIYLKEDAGKVVLGGFEPDAKVWDPLGPEGDRPFLELPEDWEQFEPFMMAGLNRYPGLETAGVQHFMNGPESFTPDTRQLMGESPSIKGFFVAAGFNSIGLMSSAGVGKVMADWLIDGAAPMDLWDVDIARFEPVSAAPRFLAARIPEAVSDQFAMHWPFKQKTTGRGLRRSPLHCSFEAAGAVFGAPTEWERPLWFATDQDERTFDYSYGAQCWWGAAAREAEATRNRVALYELTPFTKIDVAGPDAVRLLEHVCANTIDVEEGRAVYTQMLNARGGIEADVTVTRTGETAFRIVSGAATRWKDVAWLKRWRDTLELKVEIVDASSSEAVLGVMGPHARALLGALSSANFSNDGFPFATAQTIDIGMALVRATRVSFVGELGWELYVPNEFAEHVHETLVGAGADYGIAHAGHFCLDACRIEKGFRHWGHDIGPDDTPLEAGLGFAVAWDKPGGFLGRDALLRQRERGVVRKLVLFKVDDGDDGPPLLLHDEPVYRSGKLVGQTTSGARGFRTGDNLCLATVALADIPAQEFLAGDFEVSVAGGTYRATPLKKPAYDPSGARMRG